MAEKREPYFINEAWMAVARGEVSGVVTATADPSAIRLITQAVGYAGIDELAARLGVAPDSADVVIVGRSGAAYPLVGLINAALDRFDAAIPGTVELTAEPAGLSLADCLAHPAVDELIQAGIEATDNTPRTARLRAALAAFGVR